MPKGNVSKGMRRGRKMMERNKGRFLQNDPHASDKIRTRNSSNVNPLTHAHIISQIQDKNAVMLIDKLIRECKYRKTQSEMDKVITRLMEQNLHIPYIKMLYEFSGN
jgi:hypothetical protein